MLTRIRRYRLALLPALALGLAIALAACGGGDSDDAQKQLDEAFKKSIKSANVTVDIAAEVGGLPIGGSFKAKLTGPYQSNGPDKLPSMDLDLSVSGLGQSISAGLATTADNVYVTYQGQAYELGSESLEGLDENLKQQREKSKQDDNELKAAGVNPADWVTNAESEGDANVAGVETEHISADVDLDKVFDDANKLVQSAPDVGGQLGQQVPEQLTQQQKDVLSEVVKDPKMDVYVGKDDGIIRRVSVDLKLSIPEADRSQLSGVSGADLEFSVQFADVGKPVTVTPPANPKPITDLTKQLLGGGLGLPGGSSIPGLEDLQGGSDSDEGSSGSGSSGSSGSGSSSSSPGSGTDLGTGGGPNSADAKKFQEYADCVKDAGTEQSKISACTQKLR